MKKIMGRLKKKSENTPQRVILKSKSTVVAQKEYINKLLIFQHDCFQA